MYTIAEISEKLNVSKTTIYNKLSTLKVELKPYVFKKKGIQYIEDEGFEIIKRAIDIKCAENKGQKSVENDAEKPHLNIEEAELQCLNESFINALNDQIAYLKEQISIKDEQLERKDKLLENFQVIVKDNTDRILMLESKIEENKNNAGSWWNAIFKKR